jgi:hypothetical protein
MGPISEKQGMPDLVRESVDLLEVATERNLDTTIIQTSSFHRQKTPETNRKSYIGQRNAPYFLRFRGIVVDHEVMAQKRVWDSDTASEEDEPIRSVISETKKVQQIENDNSETSSDEDLTLPKRRFPSVYSS